METHDLPEGYYKTKRVEGEAYEAYVRRRLADEGRDVVNHDTREAQLASGDFRVGGIDVETKYDHRLATTGNLFIEVAELTADGRWILSGIYSRAEVRWYAIGNYRDLFVFERTALRAQAAHAAIITIKMGTSRGYLLDADARASLVRAQRHWPGRNPDGTPATVDPLTADEITWSFGGH
jgi:hypothetical protein